MENCTECLKQGIYRPGQGHHIISKKQAPYMRHVPINITPLCVIHHTSSPTGIHHNKALMIRYRQEFQLKLQLIFTKDFYSFKEIKELLECSDNTVKAITKTLIKHKEGFKTEDLIIHMMGDRSYL
jgi:hypothetical protein